MEELIERYFMLINAKNLIQIFIRVNLNYINNKKLLYVEELLKAIMEKYNYEYLRTPIFESSEVFHRGVGETTDIVTKETYEKVIKEFYEKTEPVPVCIKTLSMTVDEWLTLSTEEILEKTEDDVLASELPEHKIDEGEDYEN